MSVYFADMIKADERRFKSSLLKKGTIHVCVAGMWRSKAAHAVDRFNRNQKQITAQVASAGIEAIPGTPGYPSTDWLNVIYGPVDA